MLAHAHGLTPVDLATMTTLTKDSDLLVLAIKAGYGAAELETMDLTKPEVHAALTLSAALNADVEGAWNPVSL